MKREKSSWEPIIYRPNLPEGWKCIEQRGTVNYSQTSFVRWGKIHPKSEEKRLWIVFNEHNPYEDINYRMPRYSVRGGRDIPKGRLKKFESIKEATSYLLFLMSETDQMLSEINSQKNIDSYDKKIKDIKIQLEKAQHERNSHNSFI